MVPAKYQWAPPAESFVIKTPVSSFECLIVSLILSLFMWKEPSADPVNTSRSTGSSTSDSNCSSNKHIVLVR